MLAILREPCSDCPFKGRFLGLRSGRLKDIVDECKREDRYFVCHHTVDYASYDDESEMPIGADALNGPAAICAGFLEVFEPTIVQLAHRLNYIDWRNP